MQALGDSLSEGVQSADANRETQPVGYASRIALQMRGSFPLPLIDISPVGVVGSTFLRHRIHPSVVAADLGVSGAQVSDTLNTNSQTGTHKEYELVLEPRTTSEIDAAAASPAPLILYWAGSNDVIGAVLSFDKLSTYQQQITPVDAFRANITQAMERLKALHRPAVIGNIPDVTHTAFLMGRQTLEQFAGSDFGLPEGSYTTLITAIELRLGVEDGSILKNPDYVLDAAEIANIRQSVATFNSIIATAAADAGFPVVDVYSYFDNLMSNPPVYGGVALTQVYLGGMFSLDGIHPSDISYALLANQFIRAINTHYSGAIRTIPPLTPRQLERIARHDPFVDHKHDGSVKGRFGAGLLETLAPLLRIKHDAKPPQGPVEQLTPGGSIQEKLMSKYRKLMNQEPQKAQASRTERHNAMRHIFGLDTMKAR